VFETSLPTLSFFEQMNSYGEAGIPFVFLIDFEMRKPFLIPFYEKKDNFFFSTERFSNCLQNNFYSRKQVKLFPEMFDFEVYREHFFKIKEELIAGNTYLVNLTFSISLEIFPPDTTLFEIFNLARAKYKIYFEEKDYSFVCFSPERFVKIEDGLIFTYPMKGTTSTTDKDLIIDEKEIAEHTTVVDLLRNDLSIVAKNVKVTKFRYVEKIKTGEKIIYTTISEIAGELQANYCEHLGDIFLKLLPAGSISGAPKKKTCEIIKNVEKRKRGYYTGVFGIFDGKNVDSCVMIRFIEKINDKLYYRTGGGITIYSDPEKEYNELMEKIYVPIG